MEIYLINAFSFNGTGGSPTALVLFNHHASILLGTEIAKTLSVSHVAFIEDINPQNKLINIRFFTADGELLNCGHATIAAHILLFNKGLRSKGWWRQKVAQNFQDVLIKAGAGDIRASLKMDQISFEATPLWLVTDVLKSLGVMQDELQPTIPAIIASSGNRRVLIGVKSPKTLYQITPDFPKLAAILATVKCIGAFVYCLDASCEIAEGRFFGPNIGVNEDIINGNSSGCLCMWILEQLQLLQKNLTVFQGHKFNAKGRVDAFSQKLDNSVQTYIAGTASNARMVKWQRSNQD